MSETLTHSPDPSETPARPAAGPPPAARSIVVVVTGGDALPDETSALLPAGAFVIAADSGIDHAARLGWRVDLAIGDFDSVTPAGLDAAAAAGARVERHPTAKDATDLELALDAAIARRPRQIVVIGGHGGRVDHFLAGALALTRDASAHVEVSALIGPARLHVVRQALTVEGEPGELLTLLAVRGPVTGVTTDGLVYPLRGETLYPGSTRGVSNQLVGRSASVRLDSGVLLAVLPGEQGPARTDPPAPAGDPSPPIDPRDPIRPEEHP